MRFFPYIIKLLYYKAIPAASYNQFQTNAYNLNIFQNMYSLIWSYIYISGLKEIAFFTIASILAAYLQTILEEIHGCKPV